MAGGSGRLQPVCSGSTAATGPGLPGLLGDMEKTVFGRVEVKPPGEAERFDEVVIAAHGDQALERLADSLDREREILGVLPYQENSMVLDTDASLLPRHRAAWVSWIYYRPPEPEVKCYLNLSYEPAVESCRPS